MGESLYTNASAMAAQLGIHFNVKLGGRSMSDSLDRVSAGTPYLSIDTAKMERNILAVIDGGSKTFATDVPPGAEPLNLEGFGHVVGYPGVVLERLTEEHGMLALGRDCDLEVGDTLQVIPNHICSTVNPHDYVYLADEGDTVQEVRVEARGKVG